MHILHLQEVFNNVFLYEKKKYSYIKVQSTMFYKREKQKTFIKLWNFYYFPSNRKLYSQQFNIK